MDDDAWNKRKSKVMTFLDSNDIEEMKPVIEWNIQAGDDDAENRKRYWTSIITLLGMLPNSPPWVAIPPWNVIVEDEETSCERCGKKADELYSKNWDRDYEFNRSGICIECIPESYMTCSECENITRKHCSGSENCKSPVCGECMRMDEHVHREDDFWRSADEV